MNLKKTLLDSKKSSEDEHCVRFLCGDLMDYDGALSHDCIKDLKEDKIMLEAEFKNFNNQNKIS